ncbi:MAG: PucR family transcriptional regulator [Propionibacteriales bacterium]|nr:PucR family transcriptional regulator [Propionibacteriales bacterium]
MRLRDLVGPSGMRLVPRCDDGLLDRPVKGVFTTDLLDPRRYLDGGELVLTGLVWRRVAGDSETFVSALAEANVAGLGAGMAQYGALPDDLVAACRAHGVPLLEVPEEVSFATITRRVMTAERAGRLWPRLVEAIAEGTGLDEAVSLVGVELGLDCRALSPGGRQVASAHEPWPPDRLDRITRAFLTASRFPLVVRLADGSDWSVFSTGPMSRHRTMRWFVAAGGDHRTWSDEASDAVAELCALVALEQSHHEAETRLEHSLADEIMRSLASGERGRAQALDRLRDLEVPADAGLAVLVAGVPSRPELAESLRMLLDDAARSTGLHAVLGVHEGRAVALVSGAAGKQAAMLEEVRACGSRLAAGLDRARLTVGVGTRSSLAAVSGALDEARHAQQVAELRPGAFAMATGEEVGSYRVLLAAVPDDIRRDFAGRVLQRVIEYDERNAAGLILTLASWLGHGGSWSRCAAEMHLHVNTVRYRIGRVETLTERDLQRIEDRVDVFLALRSLGIDV